MKTILCINGSDSMGHSGVQADIRTIKDLGANALTAITSVTVQNSMGITDIYELPTELVDGQVKAIYEEYRPDAVKVGMLNNGETIHIIRNNIVGCRNIVCSPVILSSQGTLLMDNESIRAYRSELLPICNLLIVKCTDAEIMLGHRINSDSDMVKAADELHMMGAKWVLLRGGKYSQGRINAYLSPPCSVSNGDSVPQFFSSMNIDGWQRHGVGGTLSTAIATYLAMGCDIGSAVTNAHNYMHCQVVYSSPQKISVQPSVLYDKFMIILADNYDIHHEVYFYSDELSISTRYLSKITNTICGRTPKQIIDDYLMHESEQLLGTTALSVQQISNKLGFSSQIAFAKFFKAKKGFSPSSYRNNMR